MTVGFYSTTSLNNCGICLESMDGVPVIAHDGLAGDKHPWHLECIKEWLCRNNICPNCRIAMDGNALFSWKERIIELVTMREEKIDKIVHYLSGIGVLMTIGGAGVAAHTMMHEGGEPVIWGVVAMGGGLITLVVPNLLFNNS